MLGVVFFLETLSLPQITHFIIDDLDGFERYIPPGKAHEFSQYGLYSSFGYLSLYQCFSYLFNTQKENSTQDKVC
jgi:hypothetical protein